MEDLKSRILGEVNRRRDELIEEVRKLLRMPSISGSGEGIKETASYLRDWISERLGAQVTLLSYGGHPIIYGKLDVGADKTVILYNMYDV